MRKGPARSAGPWDFTLQLRIAEAVDQGVDFLPGLAVGALPVVVAGVAGKVLNGVDRPDGVALHLVYGAVNGRHTRHGAAVIGDGLQGALGGIARGNGSHEHQNVLAPDHALGIVPENDLGVGIVFRLQDIDGLVGIDGAEAALGQLLGKAGAHHTGAVQAQYGVHRGVIHEIGHQLPRAVLGLAEAGLLIGDIHIVIDVGVIGCKMAPGNAKGRTAMANGHLHQSDHSSCLRNL